MEELKLWQNDPSLEPFKKIIRQRYERVVLAEHNFTNLQTSLANTCNGHLFYGMHCDGECYIFREWAPSATAIYLIGDFNGWEKRPDFALSPTGNGNWEISLPINYVHHLDLYKLLIEWNNGSGERIPAYATRAVQDGQTKLFAAQVWEPMYPYIWKYAAPQKIQHPLIYEAHIGMSGEDEQIATFNLFRTTILPRIVKLGYNVIQLMAIQEHPYYGSFGYQVSNFFAVSSRFGTPDELKQLIDEAHKHGLAVIMDIVHSHAVKNELEGLSRFDGTDYQYFHERERGLHPVWNSRLFNYGRDETLHFLLSNCKFWLDNYHFDGFRFDGVTSMMYYDHGIGRNFTEYKFYFDGNQDEDAIIYLALANKLIHEINPNAITIAEDVSGMPGLAAPQSDGGIGFDFRMSMGVADFWVKTIKEKRDEQWHVGDMFHELVNKRCDERTISYAESHDQAMVGDKTISFRLMDKEMYFSMNMGSCNLTIDRGMALHKMIRLISLATAGDGYLSFMGNEFGHPEWIDFPREGNGWSYKYARRQWSLADDIHLRYHFLRDFDEAMIKLATNEALFDDRPHVIVQNILDQVLIFKRRNILFAFNFNPCKSFNNYRFATDAGKYITLLNSDALHFDGFGRVNDNIPHFTIYENNAHFLQLYIPNRTGIALKRL